MLKSQYRFIMSSIKFSEIRLDCEDFQLKEFESQCGDCQTDGHYQCKYCKHIASFEKMDTDNRHSFYPELYKKEMEEKKLLDLYYE